MLTKNDLQAIQGIVETTIDQRLESVNDQLGKINKDVKSLHRYTRKIKKDTETIIDHFDKRDLRLQKRVTRIEEHLVLTPQ